MRKIFFIFMGLYIRNASAMDEVKRYLPDVGLEFQSEMIDEFKDGRRIETIKSDVYYLKLTNKIDWKHFSYTPEFGLGKSSQSIALPMEFHLKNFFKYSKKENVFDYLASLNFYKMSHAYVDDQQIYSRSDNSFFVLGLGLGKNVVFFEKNYELGMYATYAPMVDLKRADVLDNKLSGGGVLFNINTSLFNDFRLAFQAQYLSVKNDDVKIQRTNMSSTLYYTF